MTHIFKHFILLLITLYQRLISPLLGPRCRFYPTCSSYSKEAIETFGLFKGIGYTLVRISKCHPFSKGGFDPVRST